MYAISKKQREEALALLAALREHPGRDTRTINYKRRAGILIRQLQKAREVGLEDMRNLIKTFNDELRSK